jgi:hypothetical protein
MSQGNGTKPAAAPKRRDFTVTAGSRPVHTHICPTCAAAGDERPWLCDSAYCNYPVRKCLDCGGLPPRHDEG